jgi:uncharacterized pyridoxal phosphate-dependent enzyme
MKADENMADANKQNNLSRRRFLQWTQAAMAAVGATPFLGGATKAFGATTTAAKPASAMHPDYYDKLGVTKVINAVGTLTVLTGCTMPPQVQAAVAEAAKHPVHLIDLQQKAGAYIAQKLKCEGAVVTSGACGALTLAAASAIMAANPGCKADDIPENTDIITKNEVIVQRTQRSPYDHTMFLCGVKFVEVDTLDEYKQAFGPKTVMTHYLNSYPGKIGKEDWLAVAKEHNIPCNVDVAAEIPPVSNLWNFTAMGFDTVCFSGGKGIRGPQNAGLLLGKKKSTDLAHANNSPYEGVGRGMKVAKEQIIGMVAAVDWICEQTDEAMMAEFNRRIDVIVRHVKSIPTMTTNVTLPPTADHAPELHLTYDPAVVGVQAQEVKAKLQALKPAIEIGGAGPVRRRRNAPADATGAPVMNSITLATWMLQPGEDEIVGRELRKALTKPKA